MNTWTVETLRAFEEEVRDIYLQGRIPAPVHLSRGNESQLLEIFQDVRPDDFVFSNYRSHYHALLKGIPREQVMEAILQGHSIHLEFPEHRVYTSAIVAGQIPIALGVALGIKRRGQPGKVWCFCGDMAALGGAFHECVQYAKGFDLPLTIVVECNNLSTNTPTHQVWGLPHQHISDGKVWKRPYQWLYCYNREGWAHVGAGAWVNFDQAGQAPGREHSDVMA